MVRHCPHCGQDMPYKRGDLIVSGQRITYNGRELTEPRPAGRLILQELVRWPVARHDCIEMTCDAAAGTVKVHVWHLRRWLVDNAVPLVIENVRGRGYRLAG